MPPVNPDKNTDVCKELKLVHIDEVVGLYLKVYDEAPVLVQATTADVEVILLTVIPEGIIHIGEDVVKLKDEL